MRDEQYGDNPALTELRRTLAGGLARMRLDKKAPAGRAGLGRTAVSRAFQSDGPVPSAQTVAALARALKLPVEELLTLQRDAAGVGGGPRTVVWLNEAQDYLGNRATGEKIAAAAMVLV